LEDCFLLARRDVLDLFSHFEYGGTDDHWVLAQGAVERLLIGWGGVKAYCPVAEWASEGAAGRRSANGDALAVGVVGPVAAHTLWERLRVPEADAANDAALVHDVHGGAAHEVLDVDLQVPQLSVCRSEETAHT